MTGALLVQIGDTAKVFHGTFTAGRGAGDLTINDEYASPRHAEFRLDGNGWTITDLGSTNGVWVNGQRVYGPHLWDKYAQGAVLIAAAHVEIEALKGEPGVRG